MASYVHIEDYNSTLDWANGLNRKFAHPIDTSMMHPSYVDAWNYARFNPIAFVGQILTVSYLIPEGTAYFVGQYEITYTGWQNGAIRAIGNGDLEPISEQEIHDL